MRKLSESEVLSLRELLQMETNSLAKLHASRPLVTDEELKRQLVSAILAAEGRVKGIQQFINENKLVDTKEVH